MTPINDVIGTIPYRIALAGGWIDQPFVSRVDPDPPGSLVVVQVEPVHWFMERSGIATSTRRVARGLWGDVIPARPRAELVRELYEAENRGRLQPSGSQDMIGMIYPGISRLDYDFAHEGGVLPRHIESCADPSVARWLERVLHVLPVAPRPEGYDPLEGRRLDPVWVRRLGRSGADCFDAILGRELNGLGAAMNECVRCWQVLLPMSFRHPALTVDLVGLLEHYQSRYPGATYACSGGGYLLVVSDDPVPGSFHPMVRLG